MAAAGVCNVVPKTEIEEAHPVVMDSLKRINDNLRDIRKDHPNEVHGAPGGSVGVRRYQKRTRRSGACHQFNLTGACKYADNACLGIFAVNTRVPIQRRIVQRLLR